MDELAVVERRIASTGLQSAIVGAFALLIGMGTLAMAAFTAFHHELGKGALVALFGLGMVAAAGVMVLEVKRYFAPRASPVYRALAAEPSEVWWVYGKVGRSSGVVLCLADGTRHTLAANRAQTTEVMELARRRSPSVILGWGKEQEAAWRERLRSRAG